MLTVKGEYYYNNFTRYNFSKSFKNFDELKNFIINHSNGDVGTKKNKAIWLGVWHDGSFKCPDMISNNSYNCDSKYSLWIYYIESPNGIEYTNGQYTRGEKHASKAFEEWCLNTYNDLYNKEFKFAV